MLSESMFISIAPYLQQKEKYWDVHCCVFTILKHGEDNEFEKKYYVCFYSLSNLVLKRYNIKLCSTMKQRQIETCS